MTFPHVRVRFRTDFVRYRTGVFTRRESEIPENQRLKFVARVGTGIETRKASPAGTQNFYLGATVGHSETSLKQNNQLEKQSP